MNMLEGARADRTPITSHREQSGLSIFGKIVLSVLGAIAALAVIVLQGGVPN